MPKPNFERDVRKFHSKMKCFYGKKPKPVSDWEAIRRIELIEEEYLELVDAIRSGDRVKIAREAIDLIYVTVGCLVLYCIPLYPAWRAVHKANMQKLYTGPLTKPMKPGNWQSPDKKIKRALERRSGKRG